MSDKEWYERPVTEGYWWGNFGGATNCYLISCGKAYLHGEDFSDATAIGKMPAGWWTPVEVAPTPPPQRLPEERLVKMTGKVWREDNKYHYQVSVDDRQLASGNFPIKDVTNSARQHAISTVNLYGVEPIVTD